MTTVGFKSLVTAELIEDGRTVGWYETDNMMTNLGEALVADRLSDQGSTWIGWMGIGTGTGQDRDDSVLATPLGARVAFDSLTQGAGADDNDIIAIATYPTGATYVGTITEGALFNSITEGVGTMLNYFTFDPPINKTSTQTLVLTVRITCGMS